jgi:hypothetical protein
MTTGRQKYKSIDFGQKQLQIHQKSFTQSLNITSDNILTQQQTFNSSPAIMPLAALYFGVTFFGDIFPSKMGRFAPLLATIQRLSKTCGFLSNKRSEGCFV